MRRRGLLAWRTIDVLAVALALGYAVGRIGCFLVGDDYGTPCDLFWCVPFAEGLPPTYAGVLRDAFGLEIPADVPANQLLAVHPTQLYETLAGLGIWWWGSDGWTDRGHPERPRRSSSHFCLWNASWSSFCAPRTIASWEGSRWRRH